MMLKFLSGLVAVLGVICGLGVIYTQHLKANLDESERENEQLKSTLQIKLKEHEKTEQELKKLSASLYELRKKATKNEDKLTNAITASSKDDSCLDKPISPDILNVLQND